MPGAGSRAPRELSRQALAEVVEPRYEELFTLIQGELRRSGYEELVASGIVLTGGSSKMEGVVELAEEVFHMPVALAVPTRVAGLADIVRNPIYSTGVGLLLYGMEQESKDGRRIRRGRHNRMFDRLRNWWNDNL